MILAFDAGTSSVKAVVASQSSQGGWVVHAYACSAHDPPDARGTGEAEQNPHSWWEALVRAVHMLSEQTDLDVVEAISLSGQMQSVILVDAAGAAVHHPHPDPHVRVWFRPNHELMTPANLT